MGVVCCMQFLRLHLFVFSSQCPCPVLSIGLELAHSPSLPPMTLCSPVCPLPSSVSYAVTLCTGDQFRYNCGKK